MTSSLLCPKKVEDLNFAIEVGTLLRGVPDEPFVGEEWPFGEPDSPLRCLVDWAVPFEECREPFAVDDSGSRRIALPSSLRRLRKDGPLFEYREVSAPPDVSWLPSRSISTPLSALGLVGSPLDRILSSEGLRRRLRVGARKLECWMFTRLSSPSTVDGITGSPCGAR